VKELRATTALKSRVNARADLEAGFTAIRDAGWWMYEDIALRDASDGGWFDGAAFNNDTRSFTDCEELLDPSLGIAVISLPHYLHREAGLAAADAGGQILMEKPQAHTLADAQDIMDACEQH